MSTEAIQDDPMQKLLDDIRYYEAQERDAKRRLAIAKAVLPGLRESLEQLRTGDSGVSVEEIESAEAPDAADGAPSENGGVRLYGRAEEQVLQALALRAPQSSQDLLEFLREHGRGFSRAAISGALRDLQGAGQVREVDKQGNLRFFALTEEPA